MDSTYSFIHEVGSSNPTPNYTQLHPTTPKYNQLHPSTPSYAQVQPTTPKCNQLVAAGASPNSPVHAPKLGCNLLCCVSGAPCTPCAPPSSPVHGPVPQFTENPPSSWAELPSSWAGAPPQFMGRRRPALPHNIVLYVS